MSSATSYAEALRQMARRDSGVTVEEAAAAPDVHNCSKASVRAHLHNLAARGHIHAGHRSGERPRYFGTREAARAWELALVPGADMHGTIDAKLGGWRPRRLKAAPAKAQQQAGSWDQRYQVDPSERVLGGFATAGIGRYTEPAGCVAARVAGERG